MGKSISHSLEDGDSELIKVTTRGMSPPTKGPVTLQRSQPLSRQRRQEAPPLYIFKPNPLLLTCGYLRDVHYGKIPTTLIELCCDYYITTKKHKSLILDADDTSTKVLKINSIDDQSYDNIEMGHDTMIVGIRIMKLSSANNLKMDWNASISIDSMQENIKHKNGTMILTVFGDINMNKHTKLLCEGDGNIYIQCNNLIMRTGAMISTTRSSSLTAQYRKSNLKQFGNIYMNIKQSLIMDKMAIIQSGNIKIECLQLKIGEKSEIKALRKDLKIIALNGILSDDDLTRVLYAKRQKKIENKNELNSDVSKITETIKENINYKLTMFEGENEEFECCICWENTPNIMIKPCHHSTFCESCIKELDPTECPICRTLIVGTQTF